MAALTNDVKIFIVQALARFETPTQVAAAVKQTYRIEVSLQQLNAYNPETVAGGRMSAKLKTIFAETREKFRTKLDEIPIANSAYRLQALNRMYQKVESSGNVALAAQLIEQAAKESGGAFTNRHQHELTGKGGAPIEQRVAVVDEKDVQNAIDRLESEY